jgi:hypothetical protein
MFSENCCSRLSVLFAHGFVATHTDASGLFFFALSLIALSLMQCRFAVAVLKYYSVGSPLICGRGRLYARCKKYEATFPTGHTK